jgi:ABC-type iron transport system FetAB ATPase subunit
VALLRTLMNDPQVLLLDEPTSALDAVSEAAVEAVVWQRVAAQQMACVLVSHKPEQIERLARRVAVLEAGCLVRVETGMTMMERDDVAQAHS